MSDALYDGPEFRCLTVVDNFSRQCLAIRVGQRLKGSDVVDMLAQLKKQRGFLPKRIQTYNGSEFQSKVMDRWAYEHKAPMDYSRPGRPTGNPFVESFNGSFQDECLNAHWFLPLEDATEKIETWRKEYNKYRPHSSIDNLPPMEFVVRYKQKTERTKDLPEAPVSAQMIFGKIKRPSTISKKSSGQPQSKPSSKRLGIPT